MAITRLYILRDEKNEEPARLIDATSPATAVRFAASRYKATPASAREVAQLVGAGTKIEVAKAEPVGP